MSPDLDGRTEVAEAGVVEWDSPMFV